MLSSEFLQASRTSTRGTIRLAESFVSRQGEGKLTGTESYFIRTSGCNLRCWFCDTPYASWSPEGEIATIAQLVADAVASGCQHVVLTGGEPLAAAGVGELTRLLREAGCYVTIETAGTIDRDLVPDLLSLSPKLASSAPLANLHPGWHQRHQSRRMPRDTMRRLIDQALDCQLKFVVASSADYGELLDLVERLAVDPSDVWIMPCGTTVAELDQAAEWLEPWASSHAFNYCDRMQIRWYGNRRGT